MTKLIGYLSTPGNSQAPSPLRYDIFHDDCLEFMRRMRTASIDAVVTDPPAGIGIHGHAWDTASQGDFIALLTEVFAEALRVAKPGAHALVWAMPRTSHWTAAALEASGWQIRDVVTHLFGKGQPGSLDISKAIDRAAGATRENMGASPNSRANGKDKHGGVPGSYGYAAQFDITKPATAEAKAWDGWGTQLRPGSEHWILARAPLAATTIADNVIEYRTGALNIDGCRNDSEHVDARGVRGRWPANAVLGHGAECANDNACLPSCLIESLGKKSDYFPSFYYGPKVSKGERGDNIHPTVKPIALMRWLCRLITPSGGKVLDPFAGTGTTGLACMAEGFNFLGLEKKREYFDIALRRAMKAANDNDMIIRHSPPIVDVTEDTD